MYLTKTFESSVIQNSLQTAITLLLQTTKDKNLKQGKLFIISLV